METGPVQQDTEKCVFYCVYIPAFEDLKVHYATFLRACKQTETELLIQEIVF